MVFTPCCSSARPWSTLRKGTTCLRCHRYSAVPRPSTCRSMVCSNRMAARMRSPVKTGLVTMRVRIAWTRSNISASSAYAERGMP